MKLALGTAQFGLSYGIANHAGQVSPPDVKSMLELAAAHNIDTLDTAICYGDSEAVIGNAGAHAFKLVTKLPAVPDSCICIEEWVHSQVSASLYRLGVRSVFGLLLHSSSQLLESYGNVLFQTLQDLKESGMVQKIGVSIYSPDELELLIPRFCFDLVQAPFNLIDRRLLHSGWLHRLKQDGVEIHSRSAFLQGLLLMPLSSIPAKFSAWNDLLTSWHAWLSEHEISALQASIGFSLAVSEIDRVIVGAESVLQLNEIIDAAQTIPESFPDLLCKDENLINPSRWHLL